MHVYAYKCVCMLMGMCECACVYVSILVPEVLYPKVLILPRPMSSTPPPQHSIRNYFSVKSVLLCIVTCKTGHTKLKNMVHP